MTRQTTVRLPEELADQAEAVARVRGTSVNALIVESLTSEIERVRADEDFAERIGEQLHHDGWGGLVASSAAHPASLLLVVFVPGGDLPDDVVPIVSTQVADAPVPPTGMRT